MLGVHGRLHEGNDLRYLGGSFLGGAYIRPDHAERSAMLLPDQEVRYLPVQGFRIPVRDRYDAEQPFDALCNDFRGQGQGGHRSRLPGFAAREDMGRLHRRMNRHERAIAILSAFIDAKEGAGERDNDLADAYYNRACTRIDHMQRLAGPPADAAKETAYTDLITAIEINPDNCLDAAGDEDFDPIRTEEQFQQLCRLDANAPPL